MIPKIIHYCWLSNDPYPEDIKACMASWKKYLPDYEFMLWNFDRFDINSSLWVKQAFESKKYAFAADYIRLYALYHYGGIYLDTDVEVLKSFDDLLDLPYFVGEENSVYGIEAATMGSEKGCIWIEKCLAYYKNKQFIGKTGKCDTTPLPYIIKQIITKNYSLQHVQNRKAIFNNKKKIYILPVDYFSPKKWNDYRVLNITTNTYSIHHFSGSWLSVEGKNELEDRNRFLKIYGDDDYLVDLYDKFKSYEQIVNMKEMIPLKELYKMVIKRTIKKFF
jgi:mannosyltransferase OCH1-like enzyme